MQAASLTVEKAQRERRAYIADEDAPERACHLVGEALAVLEPLRPLCVEEFAVHPALGRLTVRDMRQVIAVGIVIEVSRRARGHQITDENQGWRAV